ncbi:MAG TPA: hypothetical protein VMV81_05755, partial [Phycisphaerae bacterium]|nr:hypothetical protein [Phycisphaerae bacterium]
RKDLADEARRNLHAFSNSLTESPFSSERMLSALDFYHRRPREVAFVSSRADLPKLEELVNAAARAYVPNVIFARLVSDAPEAGKVAKSIPLLAEKTPAGGKPSAYVCKNFTCRAPVSDAAALLEELGK